MAQVSGNFTSSTNPRNRKLAVIVTITGSIKHSRVNTRKLDTGEQEKLAYSALQYLQTYELEKKKCMVFETSRNIQEFES